MLLKILREVRRELLIPTTLGINKSVRSMSIGAPVSFQPPGFFLGSGQPISKTDFFAQICASSAPVVLVGENHEDTQAKALELQVLKTVKTPGSRVGLSLEFYDRESQQVLDEYLAGLVPLSTFLEDSRPPANHAAYQHLLDYCQGEDLPVIASNCPRRYTRMVSKAGRNCLLPLANTGARQLLPPLPYPGPSKQYAENFIQIMRAMGNTNPAIPTSMLDSQSLWDATMADSIHQGLDRMDRVVHVTGYFHIQYRLGLVEHLVRLRPETEILTIVILPAEHTQEITEEQRNIADLVVLTDIEAL